MNTEMILRKARKEDCYRIVELYADDILGKEREHLSNPLGDTYLEAFEAISNCPEQELLVLVNTEDYIIGTLQITYIQYLNHKGTKRAIIEAVRVDKAFRGQQIGEQMFKMAIKRAKENQVSSVQLMSDTQRTDALRFYKKIGFTPSHVGFKMNI